MIALLGSIGWGLLAFATITHLRDHRRFRSLLAMHLDHERIPAFGLTTAETVLAVALPVGFLTEQRWLRWAAAAAVVLGLGFVGWIARLLLSGSSLPCACSFSRAPTTIWSLARAGLVLLVAAFGFADSDPDMTVDVATLATGLALAGALFVLPEAVAWPTASRAIMARVSAHDPT